MNRLMLLRIPRPHEHYRDATAISRLPTSRSGALTIALLRTTRYFDPDKTAKLLRPRLALHRAKAARGTGLAARLPEGGLSGKVARRKSRRSWTGSGTISGASVPMSPHLDHIWDYDPDHPEKGKPASSLRSGPRNCSTRSGMTASRR